MFSSEVMEETYIKIEVKESKLEEPLALVKRVVEVEDEDEEMVSTTTPGENYVTSTGDWQEARIL